MGYSLTRIRYQRGGGLVKELRVFGDDETLKETLPVMAASLQAVGVLILGIERNGRTITLVPHRDPVDTPMLLRDAA